MAKEIDHYRPFGLSEILNRMISNILSQQGLRNNQPRLYSGPYKNGPSATGIFANLREQIFNLQTDLHKERYSSNAREVVLSSMASKIGMLEQDLKSIKEEKKIVGRATSQTISFDPRVKGPRREEGKNGSDPNSESKKQQDIDEGAGSELAKFNTKLNNDMSMSLPAIPSVNVIKNIGIVAAVD